MKIRLSNQVFIFIKLAPFMEHQMLTVLGVILAAVVVPISTIALLKVGAVGLKQN